MQQAEFDHTDFDKSNQATLDETLLVKFFTKQRPDSTKTEEEGRPIFKDVEYVDIKIPGSNTGGACRPARQNDVERFPRHYAAYKQRQEMPEEGTPLAEWPLITRSMSEELAFFNVKTVEQLAQMADVNVSNFMGLAGMKQKAGEWLELTKDQAGSKELHEELDKRDTQIAELKAQIDALAESRKSNAPKPKKKAKPRVSRETSEKAEATPKTRRRRRKTASAA